MEIIIILTHFSTQAFNTMLTIVGTMTVPPYLLSILFLVKSSYKKKIGQDIINIVENMHLLLE